MEAIKKINNNVAICIDSKNKELIAFGKGIGFPKMPYEITDLSLISMTFYRIDNQFYELMEDIPEDVFEVTAHIVNKAEQLLDCSLNPNLIVTLADHINFAIIRVKKYKNMKMLFSYDIEQLYERETFLGKYSVDLIRQKLNVTLPESEITNIAMHFINAEEERIPEKKEASDEEAIQECVDLIEDIFNIKINRDDFSYNRFSMHLRYYLKRIKDKKQFKDNNEDLIKSMKEAYPKVHICALKIAEVFRQRYNESVSEDEILYLMIHINRIVQTTISKSEDCNS